MTSGRLAALVASVLAAVAVTAVAVGFFTSTGTAVGAGGAVGSVTAPTSITTKQTGADVAVSWNAAALSSGAAVDGYRVTRSDGATVCGLPTPVSQLACTDTGAPSGTFTYTVTAVFRTLTRAATSGSVTVLVAPTLTSNPANPSATTSSTFSYTGGSSYQCQIDGGTFVSCSSSRFYSLGSGSHTFAVRAVSGTSVGPATTYTWTIDTTAPTIDAKPSSLSTTAAPSFSFSHSRSAYTFTCQLDSGSVTACTSPRSLSGLADGSHTFVVRAVDAKGVSTPATSYTWTIDATAPTVALSSAAGLLWPNTNAGTMGFANVDGTGITTFASGLSVTRGTFSDGRYLWWATDSGTIGRANRDGTNVIPNFVTGTGSFVPGMASDGTYLYWGDRGSSRIARIPLAAPQGTAPTTIVSGANGAYGIAISGEFVYWTQQNSPIGRAKLDGTGINNFFLSTSYSQLTGIAADATQLWLGDAGSGQILRVGLDANGNTIGSPATIVSGASQPFSIATDGTSIYWSNRGGRTIGRASLNGGGATQSLVSTGINQWTAAYVPPSAVAHVAGSTVYFNGAVDGSLTIAGAVSDSGTGPASITFGDLAAPGWTHAAETVTASTGSPAKTYTSRSFSWTANPATPTGYSIGASDAAGNVRTTPLTFVNDTAPPSAGTLVVNGTAATAGGSASTSRNPSFTIGARTSGADTGAGLASSTLTVVSTSLSGTTCGARGSGGPFTTPKVVTGTAQPSGVVAGACYVYTLTGKDRVGNATSISTTVTLLQPSLTAATGSPFATGGTNPRMARFSPAGSLLAVAHGGSSTVSMFSVNTSTGALTQVPGSPWSTATDPYAVAFHPNGGFVAVPGFSSNTVSVFAVNASTGALTQVPGSPFAAGNGPVSLAFHPTSGRLAIANWFSNTVSMYSFNPSTGALTEIAGSPFATGTYPRFLAFSPNGARLATTNYTANTVSVFSVDGSTGALTQVPGSPAAVGTNPRSLAFSPSSTLLATTNEGANTVSMFSLDASTGRPTQVAGSPSTTATGLLAGAFGPGGLLATANHPGSLSLSSVDAAGALTSTGDQAFTTGSTPESVTFSPNGGLIATANFSSNNVSVFRVTGG